MIGAAGVNVLVGYLGLAVLGWVLVAIGRTGRRDVW